MKILKYLRLRGGGNRERTILHRRIPFTNHNLGPNWSLPVIRPEGVKKCIGDSASLDAGSAKTQADKARLTALVEILKHPVA
jgi:hypothetical protein